MVLTQKGIDLLHKWEGLRLDAYLCPANVPTIGYGNTYYLDGSRVSIGDTITEQQANRLFQKILERDFIPKVRELVKKVKLTDNQFSALVCFAYNVGIGAFSKSTLLKKVLLNPNDPEIANQFRRWNKVKGQVVRGLSNRREAEIELYNS